MASLQIVRTRVNALSENNLGVPIAKSIPEVVESITPSGTSQSSTDIAVNHNDIWILTAIGGPVWVQFGAAPTAAVDADHYIKDGERREWNATLIGEKVAVINA